MIGPPGRAWRARAVLVGLALTVLPGCTGDGADDQDDAVARGAELFNRSCLACHSVDGSEGAGPTVAGLFGATRELQDGRTVVADEAYLRTSIIDPQRDVVPGYRAFMPALPLAEEEVDALIAYIRSLEEPGDG